MPTPDVRIELVLHESNVRPGEISVYVGSTCTKWSPAWEKEFQTMAEAKAEIDRLQSLDVISFSRDLEKYNYLSVY